jgi:hypothetical protein
MVGVEIARQRGCVRVLHMDADEAPAHDQVIGPALRTAELAEALRQHAHAGDVERHPVRPGLGVALALRACPGEGRGRARS